MHVRYGMAEAMALLEGFTPELVLLDLGMPGVDGYAGCGMIRQKCGASPRIAALTGWGQLEDRQRTSDAGFDVHLTKPVDFSRVMALARSVLRTSAARIDPVGASGGQQIRVS